jgi:CO/xanthine dehydrogenase FAD-binding subunit
VTARYYLCPATVGECLGYLTEFSGKAVLIAGGTDLMFKIHSRRLAFEALVDTQSIRDFGRIDLGPEKISIGSAVTHASVAHHEELGAELPALGRACGSIGSPQIRNVGTLAGNVVNAQPAADAAIALVALNAEAEVVSAAGMRTLPVEDLYAGLGVSVVDPTCEILSAFHLRRPKSGHGCAYGRISPRNALCLPIVNAGVSLTSAQGRITGARIVLGPVSDRPFRPREAEESLVGAGLDDVEQIGRASRLAAQASNPRNSCLRGCTDYRKQLIRVLTGRVLRDAAAMATKTS